MVWPHRAHRLLDSRDNVRVSAASADVSAHQFAYFIGSPCLSFCDKARRRANLPGSAVTALKRVVIDECLLQWMKGSVDSKALNGRDLGAVFHNRERQTGVDPPSLDQNGTRTALAVIAAFLCAGQLEAIA
jgi:hypothetical protein